MEATAGWVEAVILKIPGAVARVLEKVGRREIF